MKVLAPAPLLLAVIGFMLVCSIGYAATERIVDYEYDGAGNIIRIITQEQSDPPSVLPLSPGFINQGQSRSITATGSNLLGIDVYTDAPGLSIDAIQSDASGISFQLTAASDAPLGNAVIRFSTGLGEVQQSIVVAEVSPAITTNPGPITIDISGTSNTVTLNFSVPRPENETFNLSVVDPATATVDSTSFNILSGQTSVDISLTGVAEGATVLLVDLPAKFYSYRFPVYVSKSYLELAEENPDMLQGNLFAASVGVLLQDSTQFSTGSVTQIVGVEVGGLSGITLDPVGVFYGDALAGSLTARPVGVNLSDAVKLAYSPIVEAVYGALVDSIEPSVVVVDSTTELTVTGLNLGEVIDIVFTPADAITLDGFTVNPEGTQLTFTLTIDPLAEMGERTVSLPVVSGVAPTRSGQPLVIELQ